MVSMRISSYARPLLGMLAFPKCWNLMKNSSSSVIPAVLAAWSRSTLTKAHSSGGTSVAFKTVYH